MADCGKVAMWLKQELEKEDCLIELPYNVVKAAYELLKDQEPRVLTLEEVKKLQSIRDGAIWLEIFGGGLLPALPEMSLRDITFLVAIPFTAYRSYMENEYYGKTWRCWSAKPSNEKRESTPWEQ